MAMSTRSSPSPGCRYGCARPHGDQTVVLATHLMGSPEFGVIDGEPLPRLEPFGLLDSLPDRSWTRPRVGTPHRGGTAGLPPDAPEDGAAPGIRPASTDLSDREMAKAAELGAGVAGGGRTLQRLRARYAQQGLWGLVDQRATRGMGAHRAGGRAGGRRGSGGS